jgi:hypothetical protein
VVINPVVLRGTVRTKSPLMEPRLQELVALRDSPAPGSGGTKMSKA